jgi:hypothetical protein
MRKIVYVALQGLSSIAMAGLAIGALASEPDPSDSEYAMWLAIGRIAASVLGVMSVTFALNVFARRDVGRILRVTANTACGVTAILACGACVFLARHPLSLAFLALIVALAVYGWIARPTAREDWR